MYTKTLRLIERDIKRQQSELKYKKRYDCYKSDLKEIIGHLEHTLLKYEIYSFLANKEPKYFLNKKLEEKILMIEKNNKFLSKWIENLKKWIDEDKLGPVMKAYNINHLNIYIERYDMSCIYLNYLKS